MPLRQACVQFSDPTAPGGTDTTTAGFLQDCRNAALARFRATNVRASCRTVEYVVPTHYNGAQSTGSIVAHVSSDVFDAWESCLPGSPAQRRTQVVSQIRLALQELGLQDLHGQLAFTPSQRSCFEPDLQQATSESLARNTPDLQAAPPRARWEGTLVKSMRPPVLVLVVSIGY